MPAAKKKASGRRKKTGRPPREIDETQVLKLAQFGCTYDEIGSFFDCGGDTIRRRFAPVVAKGKDQMRRVVRKKQLELALSGDRTMLIWLGKQILGQSEPALLQQNNFTQIVEKSQKTVDEWRKQL